MQLKRFAIIAALAIVFAAPATASADWFISPFVGTTLGSRLNEGDESFDNKHNWGFSFGSMNEGVIGWEVDFGYAPEFFEADDDDFDLFDNTNVTTVMGNVLIGIPVGGQRGIGVRPYATAGAGIVRSNVTTINDVFDEVNSNTWGINVGGGVMGYFNDRVGIRGDLRYIRSLQDVDEDLALGSFRFWRGTVGALFRF